MERLLAEIRLAERKNNIAKCILEFSNYTISVDTAHHLAEISLKVGVATAIAVEYTMLDEKLSQNCYVQTPDQTLQIGTKQTS